MKEKKKNEEFHSRREFFKKALKGILPFLGGVMIVPSILSSCDDPDDDESWWRFFRWRFFKLLYLCRRVWSELCHCMSGEVVLLSFWMFGNL